MSERHGFFVPMAGHFCAEICAQDIQAAIFAHVYNCIIKHYSGRHGARKTCPRAFIDHATNYYNMSIYYIYIMYIGLSHGLKWHTWHKCKQTFKSLIIVKYKKNMPKNFHISNSLRKFASWLNTTSLFDTTILNRLSVRPETWSSRCSREGRPESR